MGGQELREYRARPLGPEEQRMFERGGGQLPEDFGPILGGGVRAARGAEEIATAPNLPPDQRWRAAARGLHEVAGGAFEAGTALLPPAIAAAPWRTAATLALGTGAYEATTRGLQALGLPEEYANVAGDLAAVIAPAAGLPGQALIPGASSTAQLIDVAQVQGQVHAQSVQKVGELADKNQTETVAIIRTWLNETPA